MIALTIYDLFLLKPATLISRPDLEKRRCNMNKTLIGYDRFSSQSQPTLCCDESSSKNKSIMSEHKKINVCLRKVCEK